MRKILFLLLVISYLFLGIKVKAEEIRSFDSKIYLNKDGIINIEEKIVYDFGTQQRHGIFREIPFIKKNQDGKKFKLDFSDFSVVDENNNQWQFSKTIDGENIKLKIGDPNKTVSGIQTYIISYKVAGAITYFSDHDELYWNITGNEWLTSIKKATARVIVPQEIKCYPEFVNVPEIDYLKKIQEANCKIVCYFGLLGSRKNCLINLLTPNSFEISSLEILPPYNGLTFAVSFPKNIVSVLEPKEYKSFWETFFGRVVNFLIFLAIFVWYVGLPFYIIYRWFKYGRDPVPAGTGQVQAWFEPPKTPDGKRFLTPAEVGTLGDETVDLKDISATIVDLARRGYLKIEERKKGEFWLVKEERSQNKFGMTDNNLLSFEKKIIEEFFKNKKEINLKKAQLYQEVEKINKKIYQEVVNIGLFPENPDKIRTRMTILAFFSLITGNLFLAFSAFVFGRNLPRKTVEGAKAKMVAFSLRNFLKSQERQLTFQADKQMMFEKLLPYAIVFGVEKIWAQRFKDLDLKPPDWYQGYDQRSFNSVVFANSLNSSLSSFRSSATPPTTTRSTRGFSSGFSGGFSGGGGGGGGGGSW